MAVVSGLGATASAPAGAPPAPLPGAASSGIVFKSRADWVAFVKAHGGVVTHIPRGDLAGELAARYGSRYVLAPAPIRKLEHAAAESDAADIAAGKRVEQVETALKTAAAAPRNAIAAVTGLPVGLIPWLALGAAALYVANALGVVRKLTGGR